MGRHYDKGIRRAREAVASVGQRQEDPEPMTRQQVESFVRGFGVKGPGLKQIVDTWMSDQQKARDAGWESHAESVCYDEH